MEDRVSGKIRSLRVRLHILEICCRCGAAENAEVRQMQEAWQQLLSATDMDPATYSR